MSARNIMAKLLLTAGAACILAAVGLWGEARLAQGQLHLAAAAVPGPSDASQPPAAPGSAPLVVEPKQGQVIYKLIIPRIKVMNFVVYGTSDAALKKAPGHVEGTPFPWEMGNSAVAAHRDYFFWRLNELETGDEVRVESDMGNLQYKVTQKRVVNQSDVGVLSPTGRPQITLISCWPLIYIGNAPDRLVVTAELVVQ
ncbi:MAG: sortase family protein [Firmicutes bacterium]|nr:sortase family protein [Bacillota bacterium]